MKCQCCEKKMNKSAKLGICVQCRIDKKHLGECKKCNKRKLSRNNRTGICKECKLGDKKCQDCGCEITGRGKNNLCKSCSLKGKRNHQFGIQKFGKDNPNFGKKWSEEKKKQSSLEAAKRFEKEDSFRNWRDTKPELKTKAILDDLEITYTSQFRLENRLYDICLEEHKIIIEVDGVYWHGRGDRNKPHDWEKRMKVDKEKNLMAKKHGYRIVRIWEDEIEKVWRLC